MESARIAALLQKNKSVNAEQMKRVLSLLKTLRRSGIKGAQYNLVTPFSRDSEQPSAREESSDDPRIVHLQT